MQGFNLSLCSEVVFSLEGPQSEVPLYKYVMYIIIICMQMVI